MNIHQIVLPGRIPAREIDALLNHHGPDDWLPDALIVPLHVGMMACAAGFAALILQIVWPAFLPASVALWVVWGLGVPFSAAHIIRLGRVRRRENLVWRDCAQ